MMMRFVDVAGLAACSSNQPGAAPDARVTPSIALARQTPLQADTFSQCNPTGTVTYTPKANDTFAFAPAETWTWHDGTGNVLLLGQRTLRVTLDPSNYTPELLASAARCPIGDADDFTVGFDVNTGLVLQVTPGFDCIVC